MDHVRPSQGYMDIALESFYLSLNTDITGREGRARSRTPTVRIPKSSNILI